MKDSVHFEDMIAERGIEREWIHRTELDPDRTEEQDDGTRHFIKKIPEYGNR
jgi:hypothetical protein